MRGACAYGAARRRCPRSTRCPLSAALLLIRSRYLAIQQLGPHDVGYEMLLALRRAAIHSFTLDTRRDGAFEDSLS
ncbi:hypothetical protein WKI71_00470 [Streptomyces sp. MS1.AVA.1]|uniref:Uncharacterized protein n=1 Tax=Streptomyces machairae TaxID=3134109 RepID=A0ABU8UF88_9ACTN